MSGPGGTARVYLDHAATAPLKPVARDAMLRALDAAGNPSSVHAEGRAARRLVEEARAAVAALAGVAPARVVFTSGGTEANALALQGFPGRPRIVSAVEHDSVLGNAPDAPRLPVDAEGRIELEGLEQALVAAGRPTLVSLMLANNETGVIQPVAEAAALVHARGGLLHVDAVQAAGRLPLDLTALGADLLTVSAHKIGGPKGAGALLLGPGIEPQALIAGGGQERRRRAGTENVAALAGFGAAAAAIAEDLARAPLLAALRDGLEAALRAVRPDLVVLGAGAPRLGAVSCLALPGVPADTQVMALDLAGVAVSAGAACSSGKVGPSHVQAAMGVPAALAGAAIRVSLGWTSGAADVERFRAAWIAMAGRLGAVRAA